MAGGSGRQHWQGSKMMLGPTTITMAPLHSGLPGFGMTLARPIGCMRSSPRRFHGVLDSKDMLLCAAALALLLEKKDKSYVCKFESQCSLD